MLRVVMIALPVLAVGATLYMVAVPQSPSDEKLPAAATAPATQSEAPDGPPVVEARVPYPPRDVTPPGVYTGPIRSFEPSPEPAEPPAVTSRTFHRVVVDSAGVLQAGDTRVRLDGIVAPEPDASCRGDDGAEWPCGRAAMAALRLLVRNRAVECEFGAASDDGQIASCTVGGRDIASWLVEQGWAEPADGERFQNELEAARAAERGIFATGRNAAPPVSVPIPATATTPAPP